jgi:hypothetical protein
MHLTRLKTPKDLPRCNTDDSFWRMSKPINKGRKKEARTTMKEGDRILINKGITKNVMIIARTEVPYSTERIFVTKSGGKYTIGLKLWRNDYAWSEKNQMWMPKH